MGKPSWPPQRSSVRKRLRSESKRGLVVYVGSAYNAGMDTKNRRWSLRVTPAQDTIVRRVLKATGMSLNEYVVGCAVAAAADDLADRRVFAVSPQVWEELQEMLDRPPAAKPRIAALLAEPSILDPV
ncbi:MAG: DUF1778 domain-containing protein [bacterium]|nr:DUF1778 domain-containing protein [bacterium]